jgi:hypothetical protein
MWIFSVGGAVRSLFADPEFVEIRNTEVDVSRMGYHGSPEAARANAETGGELLKVENGRYFMCCDGVLAKSNASQGTTGRY